MGRAHRRKGDTDHEDNRLAYDKLTFFYMSLPYMLFGQILGALLLAALMYDVVDSYIVGIWLVLNGIVFVYRAYYYYRFTHASEEDKLTNSAIWLDRYYTDVLVSGIVWGTTAFLVFPSIDLINQVSVLLFLVTIGFASMGILASKQELLLTYVAAVFLPIIVRLFFMEGSVYQTLAFSGLALVLMMILAANYYGEIINMSLKARKEYAVTQQSYRKLHDQFFSLFERAPVGIYHFDRSNTIEDANGYFLTMLGSRAKTDILGKEVRQLWGNDSVVEMHQRVLDGFGEEHKVQLRVDTFSEQATQIELSLVPLHDDDKNIVGGVAIIKDITSEVNAQEALAHVMHYDPLTDLPNRTLLLKELKAVVDSKLRTGTYGALMFLDIDHFNNINRTYGQKVGDTVLIKIANQLAESAGKEALVARIGADTFTILLPSLSKDREESKERVWRFIHLLRSAFEKVMVVGEANYHISFTIGVAQFDSNFETPLEILKHAESTMISAKNAARGSVRFYEKERDGLALEDMAIANDIYKAIRNHEFTMYYQPQQDIHTGIMTGAEALVRWNHPRKGAISPAQFIPIAEDSGMIVRLEEWIFDQVFRDMRTMADALVDFPLNYIAVNVSSVHFLQPNFLDKFVQLVHRHRINPQWINLELTESGIMSNIDEAIRRIQELKRLGFGFSIDDFGTGYSSLTYLKKLPVDIIKIDRSFVKDADRSEEDRLIVESVIEISRRFGFKVLAEGIDRQETLDYFKGTACKTFQGYLFYKPISMQDFIQLI